MPLPSALAAKLSKRGIVRDGHQEVEEVFAESYDDPSADPKEKRKNRDSLVYEMKACPNRNNMYHTCVSYCIERWGFKRFEADQSVEFRRLRMLRKYPLPPDWKEVGDPKTGRYYYWNVNTGQVSWLSPLHPRATTVIAKDRLKDIVSKVNSMDERATKKSKLVAPLKSEPVRYGEDGTPDEPVEKRRRDHKKMRKANDLDPMDPASYSDVPRGTWSSGLDIPGDAKTGVDATASGPLFQQRPYPSPGAVLRLNKGGPPPE